jgi:CubicO group peptidase (beta-lactamase class C family)
MVGMESSLAFNAVDFIHGAGDARIEGFCLKGFEPVANAFVENFLARGEVGAAVCLLRRGEIVLDLWGGLADAETGKSWTRDTIAIAFSCTKAATALCLHLLEHRNRLDLGMPIADLWPEFAARGKGGATVRMILDHTLGLPAIRQPLKADCLLDHAYMAARLAAEEPFWEPGSRTGYHAVTMGYVAAEIVKRIDGRSLGAFFAEEIAKPLALEFWIGLPEKQEERAARIIHHRSSASPTRFSAAAREPGTIQNLLVFNHGDWASRSVNTRAGRAAEIGAAGGCTNAQSLARLYAALWPSGPLGFGKQVLAGFAQASSACHIDATLLQPVRFGPGFMLQMDNKRHDRGDSFLVDDGAFERVGIRVPLRKTTRQQDQNTMPEDGAPRFVHNVMRTDGARAALGNPYVGLIPSSPQTAREGRAAMKFGFKLSGLSAADQT